MNSLFMEQEERTFRLRPDVIANTAEGIRCLLCPLLIWADGMTPDKSRNVSINNTHLMLGWFSPELMRQVSTKIELGYPPTWTWIPESVLLKHFLDQKCFSTKTRGRDEITEFKRSIELVFWERVLSYLEYSWTQGTPLKILGRNGTYRVYYLLVRIKGDEPQQQHMCGCKKGQCTYGCRDCLYPTTAVHMWNPLMHPPRDLGAIRSDLCAVQDAFQLTRMCAARQKNAGVTREIKETIAKLDRD
jgi:hypothetical protein